MLGILYILLCICTGAVILGTFLGTELETIGERSFAGKKIRLSCLWVWIPASYLAGTLLCTWTSYLGALGARMAFHAAKPLTIGNIICFVLFLTVDTLLGMRLYRRYSEKSDGLIKSVKGAGIRYGEIVLLAFATVLVCVLMFKTFYVKDGNIRISYSVFSDFSPHLGMIRSFSRGDNFPTQYAHFAGEDIRYHFMFQFLVGNLEYLGMRLDFAFNIPSILSMLSVVSLLYALTVKLLERRLCGFLAVLFFLFRSSPSFWRFLGEICQGESISEALKMQDAFISYTSHEDWGLWNLNVYANQRHLCFSVGIMLFAILIFMPFLFNMAERLKELREERREGRIRVAARNAEMPQQDETAGEEPVVMAEAEETDEADDGAFREESLEETPEEAQRRLALAEEQRFSISGGIKDYLRVFLFSSEAVMSGNPALPILMGILLGATAFWNGAVLIACLSVLFVMALASSHKLDYLITALIAVALAALQSNGFVRGSAVSLQFHPGFLADNPTLFGTMNYMFALWGLLAVLVLFYLFWADGVKRYWFICFLAPLAVALTMSFTIDITMNHKFVMMAEMLLGIGAADLIGLMIEDKKIGLNLAGIILAFVMTVTGIFDGIVVLRKAKDPASFAQEDDIADWVTQNSTSADIFLTPNYSLSYILLGGGMLYQGWPYYAWSAGYDTPYRDTQVQAMYQASTPEELDELVQENRIRFIVVDSDVRFSSDYQVNEENIRNTYELVFSQGENENSYDIYDTQKKK